MNSGRARVTSAPAHVTFRLAFPEYRSPRRPVIVAEPLCVTRHPLLPNVITHHSSSPLISYRYLPPLVVCRLSIRCYVWPSMYICMKVRICFL